MKSEEAYTPFLAALLAGDRAQCRNIFESWLAEDVDLRELYQERLQPALYSIGDLWELGHISVATEHLASAITEGLLNLVYPRLFERPRNGQSVVVACVANEYHQIGSKMVADLFAMHGWRSDFLGANTPVQALLDLIRERHPDVVVLSLAIQSNLEQLLQAVATIRTAYPELPILVGGQGFRWGGQERAQKIANVHYLASLQELEVWMNGQKLHVS